MGKIAFVFAGQGAQKIGMGKDFYNNVDAVKEKLDFIEKLRENTQFQMWEGEEKILSETVNTQPCIFAADYAGATALIENNVKPEVVAGFSLGEIPAMAVAGVLSLEDSFNLVQKRAKFMQESASKKIGKMVAVMKLEEAEVEELCSKYSDIYPVNYNTKKQTVVAGDEQQLVEFMKDVKNSKGVAIKLKVSGAFHCKYMDEAAEQMRKYISELNFSKQHIEIYSNVTARPYKNDELKILPYKQIINPVKWRESIINMIDDGVDTFIEVGVGSILANMIKKIINEEFSDKEIYVDYVENMEDIRRVVENVKR